MKTEESSSKPAAAVSESGDTNMEVDATEASTAKLHSSKQQQEDKDGESTVASSSSSDVVENGDESDYNYESDYEYPAEEEEEENMDARLQRELGKQPSLKKLKIAGKESNERMDLDKTGMQFLPDSLAPPTNTFDFHDTNIGNCSLCQHPEDHVPVVECSMIQKWSRLMDDFGNGLLDVDPNVMKHAMKRRVEECHQYLHEVLRVEDGWPLTPAAQDAAGNQRATALANAPEENIVVYPEPIAQQAQQRADRFFAQKTVDVVASDLRHYGWDTQAWRNAMQQRSNLEFTWLDNANQVIDDEYHQHQTEEVARRINNLGLDPMAEYIPERPQGNTNDDEDDESFDSSQAQNDILADHEAFLRGTMEDDNHDNAAAPAPARAPAPAPAALARAPAFATTNQNRSRTNQGGIFGWVRGVLPGGGRAATAAVTNNDLWSGMADENSGAWMCPICMDDEVEPEDRICVEMPDGQGRTEACGHRFCRDCWTNYLHTWLEDVRSTGGANLSARLFCPHASCLALVTRDHVAKVVQQEGTTEITQVSTLSPLLKLYDDLALGSFVWGHRNTICWCPGPNCNKLMVHCGVQVLLPNDEAPGRREGNGYFTCCSSCNTRFCFHCGSSRKDHADRLGWLQCPNFLHLHDDQDNNVNDDTRNANALTDTGSGDDQAAQMAGKNVAANNANTEPIHQGRNTQNAAAGASNQVGAAVAGNAPLDLDTDINRNKIRLCPNCKIPIEKNGGCAHMRCRCGTHFCWLCMTDMTNNLSHFCGREGAGDIFLQNQRAQANQQPTQQLRLARMDLDYLIDCIRPDSDGGHNNGNVLDATQYPELAASYKKLNRFAHYYNRYVFHRQGQNFAENQCECVANRATNYSQMSKLKSAAETDFFHVANQRLVGSRRILKYSYCFLFYRLKLSEDSKDGVQMVGEGVDCPSDNALSASLPVSLALFLDHQERLERVTEQLSFLSENALTPEDRQRVVEMTRTVEKCIQSVKAMSFEQGD